MIIKITECFVHMNTRNQSKPFISVEMLSAIAIMLLYCYVECDGAHLDVIFCNKSIHKIWYMVYGI
jgi:hypothetical protein